MPKRHGTQDRRCPVSVVFSGTDRSIVVPMVAELIALDIEATAIELRAGKHTVDALNEAAQRWLSARNDGVAIAISPRSAHEDWVRAELVDVLAGGASGKPIQAWVLAFEGVEVPDFLLDYPVVDFGVRDYVTARKELVDLIDGKKFVGDGVVDRLYRFIEEIPATARIWQGREHKESTLELVNKLDDELVSALCRLRYAWDRDRSKLGVSKGGAKARVARAVEYVTGQVTNVDNADDILSRLVQLGLLSIRRVPMAEEVTDYEYTPLWYLIGRLMVYSGICQSRSDLLGHALLRGRPDVG